MSVNNMTIEQSSAFLSAVVSQMQGGQLVSVNADNFVSVAQNALQQGYDPLLTAISQVLARTIFSIRPYTGKLKSLFVDNQRFGAITRKINYIDGPLEDDQTLYLTGTTPYVNGNVPTPDQYAFRKPMTWQSNWYGFDQFQRVTTIYQTHLDTAMQGPEQFAEFLTGQMQNISDQLEQVGDAKARACLGNLITGAYLADEVDNQGFSRVVHLFTEYNSQTGASLTISNYLAPANYKPFIEWVYARIATLTDMMSERGWKFHYSPTIGGNTAYIQRHSPKDRLKAFFIASEFNRIQSMAISEVFNKDELRMIDFTPINCWQSSDPGYEMSIDMDTTYNDDSVNITGPTVSDLKTAHFQVLGNDAPINNILGVILDEEAAGITMVNEATLTSPINVVSRTATRAIHIQTRMWNDFSENCVVLMLD